MSNGAPVSGGEPRWLTFLRRIGEVAKSVEGIVALVLLLVGAGSVVAIFGGDGPAVKPAASIRVEGRTVQNRTLAEQLATHDNRTELTQPRTGRNTLNDLYGDVHDVKVTFRGHSGPCQVAWQLYNPGTNEELPAPNLVKPKEDCRANESTFHQDMWVPNPDNAESYFVRFFLLDADGTELERAHTRTYDLAF